MKRSEARLYERAANNDWPVTPEVKEKVVSLAADCVDDVEQPMTRRLGAARLLIMADNVNARREATESSERSAELQQQAATVRAMLQNPALRAALADLGTPLPSTTEQASDDTTKVDTSSDAPASDDTSKDEK